MEFFRIRRDIPFMRHALVLNVVSFITFALAVFFLATRGQHRKRELPLKEGEEAQDDDHVVQIGDHSGEGELPFKAHRQVSHDAQHRDEQRERAVLAAVLAVLGYSVNESVVIFDRIREAFRKYRKLTTPQVIDHAITSTISRTVITHGSTQMMVLSMLLFGGPTLHYFAVALTIGILFGIYSSVFVAAAIAMWLGVKREDLIKAGSTKETDPDDPNSGAVV